MFELNHLQIRFFIVLIVAIALLITERIRTDLVAVLIIVALYLTGVLQGQEALSGFGSEPAIIAASVFVLGAALHQTGIDEAIGTRISRLAGRSYARALLVVMPTTAVLSAFTHHLTITAVMLPIILNLCRERDIPASKLLMPVAFAASLGTTMTIVGAPAFIIADGVLRQSGSAGLGIFSIAPIGITLTAIGTLFMLVLGRWILPTRQGSNQSEARFRLDDYFTELTILPNSPFLNMTITEVEESKRHLFRVVGWIRERRRVLPPFGEETLRPGDVLLIRTSPEEIIAIRKERGVELNPVTQFGTSPRNGRNNAGEKPEDVLFQAVLAPDSDHSGRTLKEIDFRRRYGAIVIGLWRRSGWLQQELANIRLRPGDVLVLQADEESITRIANDRSFLMMMPFHGELLSRRKAARAAAIMLITVVSAAAKIVSIEMATLMGAVAMVLSGCLSARQAYRAIDVRIYVFIAGAVPLGIAIQRTGTGELIAQWLRDTVSNWDIRIILLLLFAVVGVITQFMSDAATTALFAPVAIAMARVLGHSPEAYAVTVAMAAVTAFLTPIGHHGNLLVYGPGRYQFKDFVRAGTPLTCIIGIVVAWMAPTIFP